MTIPAGQIVRMIESLGVTHVVYLPDAVIGQWDQALAAADSFRLVRICREGEAWALACGLWMGGARPLVMMQATGLFESGDALRNILFELEAPLYAIIGYRSYLLDGSADTARRFTEPIMNAWGLEHILIRSSDDLPALGRHFEACRQAGRSGVALLAEGRS